MHILSLHKVWSKFTLIYKNKFTPSLHKKYWVGLHFKFVCTQFTSSIQRCKPRIIGTKLNRRHVNHSNHPFETSQRTDLIAVRAWKIVHMESFTFTWKLPKQFGLHQVHTRQFGLHQVHTLFTSLVLGSTFRVPWTILDLTIAGDTHGARGSVSVERLDPLESLERLI